jgi:hypothetical protein
MPENIKKLINSLVDKASGLDSPLTKEGGIFFKYLDPNEKLDEDEWTKEMGMSGIKARLLQNLLCGSASSILQEEMSYLEIGTAGGMSFCMALLNNNYKYACVIDNWCEGDRREEFSKNIEKYLGHQSFDLYDQDCWTIKPQEQIKHKINFYFFDGPHDRLSHENAFLHYNSILASRCLCLIDDWNDPEVRSGTAKAFEKLDYKIEYSASFTTGNYDNVLGLGVGTASSWWNGLGLFLINK